jgi:hypothetical protein
MILILAWAWFVIVTLTLGRRLGSCLYSMLYKRNLILANFELWDKIDSTLSLMLTYLWAMLLVVSTFYLGWLLWSLIF